VCSVPESGQINEKFGVYESICCGAEIVVREAATFPECPNHRSLKTIWNPLDFEMILTTEIKKEGKYDPAA